MLARLLAGSLIAGCWTSAAPELALAPRSADGRVPLREPRAVVFGTYDDQGTLVPAIEVPLVAGTAFGWRIQLGCAGDVVVREELHLPAPGDWGPDAELEVSRDQRTAVVKAPRPCDDGWISRTWTLSPGDPPGLWELRVAVPGFIGQTFRAAFVRPPAP